MIKKFTTFLACMVALIGVSFSANAQLLSPASAVQSLKVGDNTGLFQLAIDFDATNPSVYNVLGMTSEGKLQIVSGTGTNIENTLWCVNVTAQTNGQGAIYNYVNKGTGFTLDVTMAEFDGNLNNLNVASPIEVGGEVSGWALSGTFTSLLANKPMYSYYESDNVVALVRDGNEVGLKIYKGVTAAIMEGITEPELLQFTLVEVASRFLTEGELNTVFNTQDADKGVVLTFDPEVEGNENPFTDVPFITETSANAFDYLNVTKTVGNVKYYLGVALKYQNTEGVDFLAYEWKTAAQYAALPVDSLGRFDFRFEYYPTYGQLYINVRTAYVQQPNGSWGLFVNDNATNPDIATATEENIAYILLQDLRTETALTVKTVKNSNETYIGTKADQNVKITIGKLDCSDAESQRTTLDDGLYYIRNTSGQYWASPLYINGDDLEFVTVKSTDQNPAHMPAYQWVILKTVQNNRFSSVTVTNREYPSRHATFYVSKSGDAYTTSGGGWFASSAKINFEKITDPTAYNDSTLGYAAFEENSLLVTKYNFNYLNALNTDKYLSYNKTKKSLNVLDGKDAFNLVARHTGNYGYNVDTDAAKRINGLVQLVRTSYVIDLKSVGTYAHTTTDDLYTMAGGNTVRKPVLFKENNHVTIDETGRHYYAIIEADSTWISGGGTTPGYWANPYISSTSALKAGIDDGDYSDLSAKIEDLSEKRTSTFAIIIDDAPIYRRFGTDPAETIEPNADDTVIMRFVEKYRGEVLQVEGNDNFVIHPSKFDMAGIDRTDKAPSGTAFVVDTAWVNRGLGYIKPQYLISMERRDHAGTPAKPCEDDYHGYAPDGTPYNEYTCPHAIPATPGYDRGKYMVNMTEVYSKYVTSEDFMWADRFDRVGFVHAIRIQDSLYVLNNAVYDFYEFDNSKANIDLIKAEAEKANGNVTKYRLDNDLHKFVTWSMRYVDVEDVDNNDFLIESYPRKSANDSYRNTEYIAPNQAMWMKMNNGCLVLSLADETDFDSMDGDDALIFNVEAATEAELATDNDKVTTTEVKVIAAEGKVTVLNAAGKKVVVSNILGQTVANTVLSSDNASIAAPKGIVVVAVEGEDAVKAIVK